MRLIASALASGVRALHHDEQTGAERPVGELAAQCQAQLEEAALRRDQPAGVLVPAQRAGEVEVVEAAHRLRMYVGRAQVRGAARPASSSAAVTAASRVTMTSSMARTSTTV